MGENRINSKYNSNGDFETNPHYKEIIKLHHMLIDANIPHVFEKCFDGWQLWYPSDNPEKKVMDAIEFYGSYGKDEDLIEIMGLLTEEEACYDSVVGYLTADEVFERIKKHYERQKQLFEDAKINNTSEEFNFKKWFELAKKQSSESLTEFILQIMNGYDHDYETVVHAIAACALAAAWAANGTNGAKGGITGFQANAIMWDFITEWRYSNNQTSLQIIDYDEMLFPQYEQKFQKTIPSRIWKLIQNEARKKLKENPNADEKVIKHWESIVNGEVPFGYKVKEI